MEIRDSNPKCTTGSVCCQEALKGRKSKPVCFLSKNSKFIAPALCFVHFAFAH